MFVLCTAKCEISSFQKDVSGWLLGAFEDSDVTHVEGEVNPVRDLEIIHEELRKKVRVLM